MNTPIALTYPVKTDAGEIASVSFRRANVGDLKATEDARKAGGDFDAAVTLVARLTGLTNDTVMLIDAEDFTALSEKMTDFLPRPATSTDG